MKYINLTGHTPKKGRKAKRVEPRTLKTPSLVLVENVSEPQTIINTDDYEIHELSEMGLHMAQPETMLIKVYPEGWLDLAKFFMPCEIHLNDKLFEFRTKPGFKPAAGYLLERIKNQWIVWEFNGILEFASDGPVYI